MALGSPVRKQEVFIHFVNGAPIRESVQGMRWLGSGGVPDLLRCGEEAGQVA